jgi:enoyl-CoA hydratase/carnithine racemase
VAAVESIGENPDVFVRSHGYVAELVLNRTAVHNALSTQLSVDITQALSTLVDDGFRAVVVSSQSTVAFCVGADLKERGRLDDAGFRAQRTHFRDMFGALLTLPIPAVAAVHGFALGGGYELALCCDLIVADDTAVVGLPEVTLGIVPGGGGTQLVTRRSGYATGADLLFTGRRVPVDEAYRLHLVDRVVPAGTDREAALDLAATIAANSPVAVRNAKHALRRGQDLDLAEALAVEDTAWRAAIFSGDRVEGVRAFLDKRPPVWPS